mmetsp:Transcript_15723/g.36211  ORF Transcript_15723/g.36211 Transcript_15723/m.36211 type:complete len:250 (-) Transcript_15723:238-987(-)|eukprot:CAMPEP_0172382858 /NCGR_PEP_ID=MMETSP1061-20121228/828_1 /TAXON_ID=37318 /ORGANISM="Pseudo-nitzschia pungens, Strain cf. pungens" /LENGTH=249 /DNA_ID=CAMNT_0013110925 /DNA_START=46 /DNA_END=795 /DNA_ORIENTATION=+
MTDGFRGNLISSKRGLLASLWSVVTILTVITFLTAFIYALSTSDDGDRQNYNNNEDGGSQDEREDGKYEAEVAVTSRALAFSALWTGVLAALLSIFGTVILGWQSPTGQYYTCCSSSVHRTTPLGIGSFIGALLMFANLTLVCSVLFGEFQIRDNREGEDRGGGAANQYYGQRETRSMAFSIMCIVLTILYGGFAALTLAYAPDVINEHALDERDDIMMTSTRNKTVHFNAGYDGYIGERFDVGRTTLS